MFKKVPEITMDKAYSILMWVFSGGLFLYALVLFIFKDTELIPKSDKAKITDKKTYAKQFAKVIALVALAPMLSGIVGFLGGFFMIPAVIVLIGGVIAAIIIGIKIMPKE